MIDKKSILIQRSEMLKKCRFFFEKQKILEVDCPCLTSAPAIDNEIEPMRVDLDPSRYLHTSPEYAMKRLLAEGVGDIFQISHVFRHEELGAFHNPEFTLIEWYRENISYADFLDETVSLIQLFLPKVPVLHTTYREIFLKNLDLDPFLVNEEEILKKIKDLKLSFSRELLKGDQDALLQLLLSHYIEPKMKKNTLTILDEYPLGQAALAKTKLSQGVLVAERFEIYFEGLELANGYHELSDSIEQRKRFVETNKKRKFPLPLDERFIQAVSKLKDTFGVAVGFDRLFMLQQKKKNISEIMPFSFENI